MAQHDYDIANQTGAAFRADLNNCLSAIATVNSGPTEPNPSYAYQLWADTTAGQLKQRNASNSAWVVIGTLGTVRLGLAPTTSPTFSGTATFATITVAGAATFTGTGGLKLPASVTADRPSPVAGLVRFNTTLGKFEGYNGTRWGTIGGGATGGGDVDDIFHENGQTVTESYTITAGKNAMTAGPVTIASGVTVTVPSGSNWIVI